MARDIELACKTGKQADAFALAGALAAAIDAAVAVLRSRYPEAA